MDFYPKVSVVIPVYNGTNFMREAVDSALNQSYKNIEIIVINDGSTDETEQIALSYGDKIRYFRKENGGQSSALNFGIAQMTGDYFSWLSHDDVYLPDKIEKQIDFLRYSPDKKAILYSDFESIDKDSRIISKHQIPVSMTNNIRYQFLTAKSIIHGCSTLIHKTCFESCGVFELDNPNTSDVRLFYRMSEKYQFVHIPKILVQGRVHYGQMSYVRSGQLISESNDFLIYCFERIKPSEAVQASGLNSFKDVLFLLCKNYAKGGYYKAYRYILRQVKDQDISLIQYLNLEMNCRFQLFKKSLKYKIKYALKM